MLNTSKFFSFLSILVMASAVCWAQQAKPTRQERIQAHEERIDAIVDEAKARKAGVPYKPSSPTLARMTHATTSGSREARIEAHQKRIQAIIEASRQRRTSGYTSPTVPLDYSATSFSKVDESLEILPEDRERIRELQGQIQGIIEDARARQSGLQSMPSTHSLIRQTSSSSTAAREERINAHEQRIQSIVKAARERRDSQQTTATGGVDSDLLSTNTIP